VLLLVIFFDIDC